MSSFKIVQSLLAQVGMGPFASTNAKASVLSGAPVPSLPPDTSITDATGLSMITPPPATSNPMLISPDGVQQNDPDDIQRTSSQGLPPASLTYWIADLKLTAEGKVKILEFGRGVSSAFEGYEALYGVNMHTLFYSYVREQLGLSIWFLPHMANYMVQGQETTQRYALDYLTEKQGLAGGNAASLKAKVDQGRFGSRKAKFEPADITTYSGLVIFEGGLFSMGSDLMNEVLAQNPQLLLLDDGGSTLEYVGNKFLSRTLFKGKHRTMTPHWKLFPKKYSAEFAPTIKRCMPSNRYVIKPLDSSRGRGITVVDADDLDDVLRRLFGGDGPKEVERMQKEEFRLPDEDNPYEYWLADGGPVFLVETYETSRPIQLDDAEYDGTMRVVFTLERDNDATSMNILDGYWKLPPKGIGQGDLRGTTISKIEDERMSAHPISTQDMEIVKQRLKNVLPDLYRTILSRNPADIVDELLSSDDSSYVAYGIFLCGREQKIKDDQIVQLTSLADKSDDLYDAVLIDLLKQLSYRHIIDAFVPLVDALSRSRNSDTREAALYAALEHADDETFAAIARSRADDVGHMQDLKRRARYASFLYESGVFSADQLLEHYESIFSQGHFPSQKFILRDLLEKNMFFKAPWLKRYLEPHNELLFAHWIHMSMTEQSALSHQAARAGVFFGADMLSRVTPGEFVHLLRAVIKHRELELAAWFVETFIYRIAATSRDTAFRRLRLNLHKIGVPLVGDDIHQWFKQIHDIVGSG